MFIDERIFIWVSGVVYELYTIHTYISVILIVQFYISFKSVFTPLKKYLLFEYCRFYFKYVSKTLLLHLPVKIPNKNKNKVLLSKVS